MKKRIICIALMIISLFCLSSFGVTFALKSNYPYLDSNGGIDQKAYFETKNLTVSSGEEYLDFVLNGNDGDFSFNKELAGDNFSLAFAGSSKNSGFKSAEIFLSDYEDSSVKIKIRFDAISDNMTSVTLNDSYRSYIVPASLYVDSSYEFGFTYNKEVRLLDDNANFKIPVTSTVSGNAFSGFPSQKIKLSVHLTGSKSSFFRLKSLNRQRFGSYYTTDKNEPMICISDYQKNVAPESEIALPVAFALDVLSNKSTVKMTVQDTNGKIVSATDGTKLDKVNPSKQYHIKTAKSGMYKLIFKASDGKNSTRSISSQILIIDEEIPKLQLAEKLPQTVAVGNSIAIPEIAATDNISKDKKIVTYVTVKNPEGIISAVKDSYAPKTEGEYVFSFCALDEAGNMRRITQKIFAYKGENKNEKDS